MDAKEFLGRRRDRAIAELLGFKEREVDYYLPDDVAARLRKEILDQVNDLTHTAFDLLGSGFNQEFLDRIDEIYVAVTGG